MGQPSTIYKPGKLNYVWNYLSSTLDNFKAKLLGYRNYTALLTQTGTSTPVATVLQNNLGQDIVWTYKGVGAYVGTAVGAFVTQSKVAVITSQNGTNLGFTVANRHDNDTIYVETYVGTTATNAVLSNSLVEIRVYL